MVSRTTMAIGTLGVGALALIGAGSFASFTGQANVNTNITSGTFSLAVVPGSPSVGDLINGQSLTPGTLSVYNSNTLTYVLKNADPGHTYTIPFTVYDNGSLPGVVNSISYTPGSNAGSALASDMTISLCYVQGNSCLPISTPNVSPGPSSITTGNVGATFDTINGGGDGLTNFLGSNPTNGTTSTGGGWPNVTYRITEKFNGSSTNAAQGENITQTFTINGNSL